MIFNRRLPMGTINDIRWQELLKQIQEQQLTHVNIGRNHFELTPTQIQSLARVLTNNATIRDLNLYDSGIQDVGAKYLSEALETNTTLTSLNLAENQIGEAGAKHLSEALETNTTLMYLNLAGNQIGDSGAKHLAEALQVNHLLSEINHQDPFPRHLQDIQSIIPLFSGKEKYHAYILPKNNILEHLILHPNHEKILFEFIQSLQNISWDPNQSLFQHLAHHSDQSGLTPGALAIIHLGMNEPTRNIPALEHFIQQVLDAGVSAFDLYHQVNHGTFNDGTWWNEENLEPIRKILKTAMLNEIQTKESSETEASVNSLDEDLYAELDLNEFVRSSPRP
jgi:hypothetical protein